MNPYFLTNILLTCLIACKVLILLYNRTLVSGDDLIALLIAALIFYIGMIPIAEYFTGQKTISSANITGQKIGRDETCGVIFMLALAVPAACSGALIILTVGS